MGMNGIRFYGLLYIDAQNNKNVNVRGVVDPNIYILCASLCSKTFRAAGSVFCIITNEVEYVRKRFDSLGLEDITVFPHDFISVVPTATPFYATHFKLDIYRAFGRGVFGEQVGLIDLDTVLLRKLPSTTSLAVYDITEQVIPTYGRRIGSDMELVSGRSLSDPRWYGGEFIMGTTTEFATVSQYTDKCWTNYLQNISSLHHVGDEMIVSSALNMARGDGVRIVDYGRDNLVARWWTARTEHRQAAFDAVERAALLHLPADKTFLAKEAPYEFETEKFLSRFRRHARNKIAVRSIVNAGTLLLGGGMKFTPRLTSK
jgi:hypothetical protein